MIPLTNFKIKNYKTENKKPYKTEEVPLMIIGKWDRVAVSLVFILKVLFVSRISKRRYSRRLNVLVGGIRAGKDGGVDLELNCIEAKDMESKPWSPH